MSYFRRDELRSRLKHLEMLRRGNKLAIKNYQRESQQAKHYREIIQGSDLVREINYILQILGFTRMYFKACGVLRRECGEEQPQGS